jgi:hypothetical protein
VRCRPMQERFAKHDAIDERKTVPPFQGTARTSADLNETEASATALSGIFGETFGGQTQ